MPDSMNDAAGGPERDTERRRGTVMFADITGFTTLVERSGDEEAYRVVTECLKVLDRIARRYGATVDKYQGDCIMALFGVPNALEDAPRAAVNAAIEMRRAVADLQGAENGDPALDLHTGINTGSFIYGDLATAATPQEMVLGDAVNVAARLKDMAPPGEIWVGPETWQRTRRAFEYERVGALALKGKQQTIEAWAVRSESPHEHGQTRGGRVHSDLVGREAEIRVIDEALADLAERRGRVLLVVGEPGLGKTRLLLETESRIPPEGLWLVGRCLSIGRTLAYHPFQDLVRRWLDLGEGDEERDARVFRERLHALLPDEAGSLAPLLATMLGLPLPEDVRRDLHAVQGDVLQRRIRSAVVRVLVALAEESPVTVVLDDVHWADDSSLELLEELLPLAARLPILFLLSCRPFYEGTSDRVQRACRECDGHRELRLGPLDTRSSREQLDNFFGSGGLPFVIREAIIERTAGNPFFAEEVVSSLIDEGAAEFRDGVLVATDTIDQVQIPGSIHEVVMARIDALDPVHRKVLEAAAVIGRSFYEAVLERVLRKEDVEPILEDLDELGLLQRTSLDARWRFRHPILQEVAYETILEARRRELHREVASTIETLLTRNVAGYHAMLAYHFVQGGDFDRAEEYLFQAGDEATRTAASSEALRFFESASDLFAERYGRGGDPLKRARLEKAVAMALFNRGRLVECIGRFDRALATLGDKAPTSWTSLYLRFALELGLVLPRLVWEGGRKRPATEREREILEMRFNRQLAGATADPAFAFHTLSTLRLSLRVDPATVPGSAGLMAGAVGLFSFAGLSFALGRRVLEISERLAAEGHLGDLALYQHLMVFIHHFLEGDWSAERRVPEALVEDGLRYGRMWEVGVLLDLDAELSMLQGDLASAALRVEQLRELAERYDHGYARTAALSVGALLLHHEGRDDEALESIDLYRTLSGEQSYQVVAGGIRARIECGRGRLSEAREGVASADAAKPDAGRMTPFHLSFLEVPRYALDLAVLERAEAGERRATRRAARRSRRTAVSIARKVAPVRSEVLRLTATHDWLLGRYDAALQAFGKALATAEALGAKPELVQICTALANRLASSDGPSEHEGRDAAFFRARADEHAAGLHRSSPARADV